MNNDILYNLDTPCYVVDEKRLVKNLECLKYVMEQTGCDILLAQKAFSMYHAYPLIGKYLAGTTASGLYEAKLGREKMPDSQVHVFSPAYKESDIEELSDIADHIIFNSFSQWEKYKNLICNEKKVSCGIRINPEYSEVDTDIYNPCSEKSRLGVRISEFEENIALIEDLDGIHFHTMCEQGEDVLERTLEQVENKFGKYLNRFKWVNFGGGHHITRGDYDVEALIRCIKNFQNKYDVHVYMEPGEAVALNAGTLVTTVLEVQKERDGVSNVILDTSAACHMPDVLEMPYRPSIKGAGQSKEKKYTYRFGGPTCLAGDVIGEYSFDMPLKPGDRIEFEDMAIYTMVKNNTFNGIPLPDIDWLDTEGKVNVIKKFEYEDFKIRL